MACEQVVVTLTPVYSPDTLPFRSLTFLSDNDTVPIGRASKSETKNLVPNHDNGWFDSRVMSREHGVLGVKMEDRSVYVRDHGSLHGTQLNDVKITPKQNVTVNSGDVLTFGSEISRGTQTFRPIAVRLDCQWHEKPTSTPATKSTTNTFSVPDEEDDVIEVVEYKAVSKQQKTSPWSDSSEMEYGSDMSRPLDLTSPVTSPEIKVSHLPDKSIGDANDAPRQNITVVAEELVIPPSSPPAQSDSPGVSEDENQSESEEEDDASESGNSEGDEQKGMFDDDSEDSEDDQYEGSDWGEEAALDAQAPAFSAFEGEMARPSESTKASRIPAPAMVHQVQPGTSTDSAQQGISWPGYLVPRAPSPSDKAMAKPIDIPAPAVARSAAPAYQSYSNISPAIQAWASRNQGPSSFTFNDASQSTNSFALNNANESFPFGPHRSSGGYLRHFAYDISGGYDLKTGTLADGEPEAVKKVDEPVNTPVGASFSETNETCPRVHPSSSGKLKRKADAFEDYFEDQHKSQKSGNTEDSITDAQPRPDIQDLELTQSPIAEMQPIKEVAPTRTEQHRRKRVKPNKALTLMKYAAVAAIGAAVGSIGTIAGLSSLPADFFN